jgi:hypothetical protein
MSIQFQVVLYIYKSIYSICVSCSCFILTHKLRTTTYYLLASLGTEVYKKQNKMTKIKNTTVSRFLIIFKWY